MLVVSAYTPGYAKYAAEFERSVAAQGLPVMAVACPEAGSWLNNVAYKAAAVLRGLSEAQDWVMFLDVDSVMQGRPRRPAAKYDFACYYTRKPAARIFDFDSGIVVPNSGRVPTPAGSPLYFAVNSQARRLVETWVRLLWDWRGLTNDEQCLREALRLTPGLKVQRRSSRACYIFLDAGYNGGGKPRRGGV